MVLSSKASLATDPLALWLKQHGRGEKALATVLEKFFRGQVARILKTVKDEFGNSFTPSVVSQVFRVADERDAMMEAIKPNLIKMLATGASTTLAAAKPKGKKEFDFTAAIENFQLPTRAVDAIAASFAELESQSYWQDIQSATSDRLTTLIQTGVEKGMSGSEMAKAIQDTMGDISRSRAAGIARTESTLAFNSGKEISYSELAADPESGFTGKTWIAILDSDTREDHAALDHTTVAAGETFSVGGEQAKYPGDVSLSAGQRVRCRCTTVASFS